MSITSERSSNYLPPNVRGKCRGTLKLTILDIVPRSPLSGGTNKRIVAGISRGRNSAASVFGSGGISVKFIFWGQNHENSAIVKYQAPRQSEKYEPPFVVYSIRTNCSLFQNYLSNCEPIEVKLTANTSNLQVGTAFVRISKNLIDNCATRSVEEIQSVKIFSPRNTTFGELKLKFNTMFYSYTADSARILSSKSLAIAGKFHQFDIPALDSNRSAKSYKSNVNNLIAQKSSRPVTAASSTTTLSSNAMAYLTGREMSEEAEKRALVEIQNCSPLEDVVSTLTIRLKTRDVYDRIDSLRLIVESLTIAAAGMRELETDDLGRLNFTIEADVSPNLYGTGRSDRAKYNYDVMRFYSDYIDGKEKRIDFNRDAMRSIRISEFVDNAYIALTIWSRPFGSRFSRCFGTAKFQLGNLFESGKMEQEKKLSVKSCTDKIVVGQAVVKVILGTKGVHFGEDFMTIIHEKSLDDCPTSDSSKLPRCKLHQQQSPIIEKARSMCRKCNHNNETNKAPNTTNSTSESNSTGRINSGCKKPTNCRGEADQTTQRTTVRSEKDNDDKPAVKLARNDSPENKTLLHGLIYVGSIRNVRELQNGGYFLVCRAFWKEDATSTEFCQDNRFDFLETFPVINNEKFLERTRNNHLDLELWQKFADTPEQMVGVVKLPLHQFFIAFRDNVITSHLSQAKLPVISIDGWVTITSPLSGECCGQLQTLLAIGTEEQLEYLKASRGLSLNTVCDNNSYLNRQQYRIPVPQNVPKSDRPLSSCDAESQTNFKNSNQDNASTITSTRQENLSDLLGNFIENLAQRLPSGQTETSETEASPKNPHTGSTDQPVQGTQVRKTADLLDVLQKALVTPPGNLQSLTNSTLSSNLFKPTSVANPLGTANATSLVKILLEIENALHLPQNRSKVGSKKLLKRSSGASKSKQSRLATAEEEPSAYVTFQAEEGSGQMLKSHEGLVYATHIVEKSCDPVWNRKFEIFVPTDLMKNDEKRFILKVWRKRITEQPQCRLLPAPLEDAIIGFAAIDLNVLLAGMPCIAGWFNIVDFNGRINGQIKVNVRPLEDLQKFKKPSATLSKAPATVTIPDNVAKSIAPPAIGLDINNSVLSRAIKRKFTELEEITERLRARLLDVTGAPDKPLESLDEEAIDTEPIIDEQLDEFEHDLNTECDEDEESTSRDLDNFGWLGTSKHLQGTDDGDDDDNDEAGGHSSTSDSQERVRMIAECLRKTGLSEGAGCSRVLSDRRERNPPEGRTASSTEKKHID